MSGLAVLVVFALVMAIIMLVVIAHVRESLRTLPNVTAFTEALPARLRPEHDEDMAYPGDEDLDYDVAGMVITSVIAERPEVWVGTRGGHGRFFSTESHVMCEDLEITEGDWRMRFGTFDDEAWEFFVALLERWRDDAVPLHMVGTNDKMFQVIDPAGNWLPLPRRTYEGWPKT